MEQICLILEIKENRINEYISIHKDAKENLLVALKDSGFVNEYIFMLNNYSIIFMESEDVDRAFKIYGATNAAKDWAEKITPLLKKEVEVTKDGKLKGLEKVFDLTQQLTSKL